MTEHYDAYFVRDNIRERVNVYKFEIAKLIMIDENLDEQTQDDIVLFAINEFISVSEFTSDEIEFAIDTIEEACYKMANLIHTLKNEE